MNLRLRSLEIQGFKSFPDRTRLSFNDGITAVVGPNGSGKSNIADAVRWVLGEQSTRTLRGGRMEDVIFGGTQNRKPQGYAQVQLTIDNADRVLPYESDEVTISRKLYRSGESEYRINQASVRLKDIYELFMDTGLGRDGYSIIGQGKIAEIVSARSSQRREIFEEAAGISKYRYRKLEAQRRLEGAEENLLRLKDILAELESRVEPLREQAEKAMQFLEFSQEKRTLEISLWVQTLERSKESLREQEDKILLCKKEHDEIQEELDGIEEEINRLFVQMQQISVEVDGFRTKVREIEEQSAQEISDMAVMRNDISHNEASIGRIQEELEQSDVADEELRERIATYEKEVAQKECRLAELQSGQEQEQMRAQALVEQRTALGQRIEALKERRFGLTQSINEAKLSSASSSSLIDETILRLQMLKDSAVVKDENIARIQQESADCEGLLREIADRIQTLENAQTGYQIKYRGRQEKYDRLAADRRSQEDQVRGYLQKAKLLQEMENNLEGFQQSVRYVMSQAEKGALQGVYGPVSRLISVSDEHALAVEIALGAAMQNIIVEDEPVAKRAIAMLKNTRSGRATFLPISTVKGNRLTDSWLPEMEGFVGIASDLVSYAPEFEGVIRQLLGRVVIVQDLDCALPVAKRASYRFRIVTLDGQVMNSGGSMTGGYSAKSAGILSRTKEIDALNRQAESCQERIRGMDAELKGLQEDLSALQAKMAGIQGELSTAQEDRIRFEARSHQLKRSYEEAVSAKKQAAQEYGQLTERLQELKSQSLSSGDLEKELSLQLSSLAEELSEAGLKREGLAGQAEAATEKLAQYRLDIATLSNEIGSVRQMAAELAGQKQNRQMHIQLLHDQRAELETENRRIRQKIVQMETRHAAYAEQAASLQQEIAARMERRNACEAQANGMRAQEKEVTGRREQAGRELARLEEKKNALQSDYDAIIGRLWDEYEITRSQAVEQSRPVSDINGAQRRLNELKSRIKALGTVNVGAVEEYQEVSERYRFLKSQIEDIENSRTELNRLIDELTMDMQSIFTENFSQISEHFAQVFTQLFDGGRGELSLTDPQNVLDSGIEIYVQPPGKIIKNLAALSGGEQAFVAIAIYFAILKVRPSPFVLLDEIEAALDDVNVVKYAQYLRTMCGKTQFIAITHRRGTMEEADVLYGVTMQEEGVSKLLELNVGEIESKLGIS